MGEVSEFGLVGSGFREGLFLSARETARLGPTLTGGVDGVAHSLIVRTPP